MKKKLNCYIKIKHGFAFESRFFTDNGKYIVLTPGNFNEFGGFRSANGKTKFYCGEIPIGYILKKNDLLVVMTEQAPGLLGAPALIPQEDRYLHNQRLGLVELLDSNRLDKEYLFHLFNLPSVRQEIEKNAAGTKVRHTSPDKITAIEAYIPSFSAQVRIAHLLSHWGSAIERTERLIEYSELRLQALMQQLLSGSDIRETAREGWKVYRLGDLFSERIETDYPELPLLSITGNEGVVDRELTGRKDTSSEDKSKYVRICPGDIGYNTMRMWQGVSALSSLEGIVSPAYTIVVPGPKIVGEYAAHLFKYSPIINQFYRYSQGLTSDTWNLKFDNFSEILVRVPDIGLQKRTIRILDAAIKEKTLLKKKIEALSSQKSFLMSKLLTGEWEAPELKTR